MKKAFENPVGKIALWFSFSKIFDFQFEICCHHCIFLLPAEFPQVQNRKGAAQIDRKWPVQIAEWEAKLDVRPGYAPWTSRQGFQGLGLPKIPRVLRLVDLVAAQKTSDNFRPSEATLKKKLDNVFFLDFSQNPCRKPFTNKDGINHTLATSSQIYSFAFKLQKK